jgi:hypothetical protein
MHGWMHGCMGVDAWMMHAWTPQLPHCSYPHQPPPSPRGIPILFPTPSRCSDKQCDPSGARGAAGPVGNTTTMLPAQSQCIRGVTRGAAGGTKLSCQNAPLVCCCVSASGGVTRPAHSHARAATSRSDANTNHTMESHNQMRHVAQHHSSLSP